MHKVPLTILSHVCTAGMGRKIPPKGTGTADLETVLSLKAALGQLKGIYGTNKWEQERDEDGDQSFYPACLHSLEQIFIGSGNEPETWNWGNPQLQDYRSLAYTGNLPIGLFTLVWGQESPWRDETSYRSWCIERGLPSYLFISHSLKGKLF